MLTTDRLGMLDEFGSRKTIIPAEVRGFYRRRKSILHFILLLVFLGLPWLRIGNTQALLFDIPNRHFEIFGKVFLSHDSPLIFFIFLICVLSIMLVTALWGRVWCGWACPQTVFIDTVYRKLEYWVEGNYIQRRRLRDGPLSGEKIFKSSVKWALFALVSSAFAHSFIAYFVGSQKLLTMMQANPGQNWSYFIAVISVSALLLFNFGWFREQFCILMCPYGRFQGVLMDTQTYNIHYDFARGEPRRGTVGEGVPAGDCVACNRCVQVCPTGIDIRNGLQMECIGCTACVDACDTIMEKIKKPTGLISYRSEIQSEKINFFRFRVLAYFSLLILSIGALAYNVAGHLAFSAVAIRSVEAPFQRAPDGKILNHFKIHLHSQSRKTQDLVLALKTPSEPEHLIQPADVYHLSPESSRVIHVFISFSENIMNNSGTGKTKLIVKEKNSGETQELEITLLGPVQN